MTDLRRIAAAMGGEVAGNLAKFPTPGHSKHDRGSWAELKSDAPDGVLIHSANGGDWRAIKDELRQKGALDPRDEPERNRDVAAWEYTDADGTVLYRKVRMALAGGGKSYRFEHPDGRGGWKPKRGDAPQVPYRLPDLTAAPADALIYMAEGEKQADKLAAWGFVATSSKDWRSFDFSGYVKGRTVIILPDNDDEGARIAQTAKEAVERADGRAVVLDLPGLPHKGDVMDWRGDAAELRRLTDVALRVPVETFPLIDLAAWASTDPEPRQWALDRLVPKGEVTLFTGPGGVGKSLFAQQLATCHAAGLPMLGVDTAGGATLYLTAEDDDRELHWRQAHISRALRAPIASLAGKLHLTSLRGRLNNELATFDGEGRLRTAPAYALLRGTIEATGAALVVLDNVAHLFAGNENDRGQVTAFANLLNALCRDLGTTIILIGHPNKAGDDYSGSTAWLNAVRSQVTLKRPEDALDPDTRVVTLGKANYARQGEQTLFRWHDFAFVLDTDLPDNTRAELAANAQAAAENAAFLKCLAAATANRRAVSHNPGVNYYGSVFPKMTEGNRLNRAAYERAFERLLYLGEIELDAALWQDTHRHWKQGIRAVEKCGDPPAGTPRGDLRATPSQVIGNAVRAARAATPLYTTYKGGAADGPPPSYEPEDLDWGSEGGDE
jgi:RecA-family ATPase